MFEKYDINDLYLAYISVCRGDGWEINLADETESLMTMHMYKIGSYLTILNKIGENQYTDLRGISKKTIVPCSSFKIDYMEPLNKYYGSEIATSKRRILGKLDYCFHVFCENKSLNDKKNNPQK